jgi:hypothetical protein
MYFQSRSAASGFQGLSLVIGVTGGVSGISEGVSVGGGLIVGKAGGVGDAGQAGGRPIEMDGGTTAG